MLQNSVRLLSGPGSLFLVCLFLYVNASCRCCNAHKFHGPKHLTMVVVASCVFLHFGAQFKVALCRSTLSLCNSTCRRKEQWPPTWFWMLCKWEGSHEKSVVADQSRIPNVYMFPPAPRVFLFLNKETLCFEFSIFTCSTCALGHGYWLDVLAQLGFRVLRFQEVGLDSFAGEMGIGPGQPLTEPSIAKRGSGNVQGVLFLERGGLLEGAGLGRASHRRGLQACAPVLVRHWSQILAVQFQGPADWGSPRGPHRNTCVWEALSWCPPGEKRA